MQLQVDKFWLLQVKDKVFLHAFVCLKPYTETILCDLVNNYCLHFLKNDKNNVNQTFLSIIYDTVNALTFNPKNILNLIG